MGRGEAGRGEETADITLKKESVSRSASSSITKDPLVNLATGCVRKGLKTWRDWALAGVAAVGDKQDLIQATEAD